MKLAQTTPSVPTLAGNGRSQTVLWSLFLLSSTLLATNNDPIFQSRNDKVETWVILQVWLGQPIQGYRPSQLEDELEPGHMRLRPSLRALLSLHREVSGWKPAGDLLLGSGYE